MTSIKTALSRRNKTSGLDWLFELLVYTMAILAVLITLLPFVYVIMASMSSAEAVFGGNMKDINLILENIVFMELFRRGYDVRIGKVGEKEIDFVCEKKGEKLYIQVAYLLASPETIEREFGVYDAVRDNFPKYVVTMDEINMSRNGIKRRNIRDFLLAEEWN